jgi:GalNAc-alpha-(1->4)-GalNAc-alpha-(1->3)-diNAcBac-PP-undecaprenol alpha-1,4-N-acetyl-D-galactosaminyltransferase
MPPKNLVFIINIMSAAGAQRRLSILVNFLSANGWSVTLLTFDDGSSPSFYKLDSSIRQIPLAIMRKQKSFFRSLTMPLLRPWILRRAIRRIKPDVIIPFGDLTGILTLVSIYGLNFSVMVSEAVHPKYHVMGRFWGGVREWVYRCAHFVVVQTEEGLSFFSPEIKRRSRVIPSPVLIPNDTNSDDSAKSMTTPKTLMAMGRLNEQKGFDLLLNAFARVSPNFPEWMLNIWGEGDQRGKLEFMRDELGLAGKVNFPGITSDSYGEMKKSDLFVLSSRFEGFPNVLCEAMACGMPVVSFECPSGPGSIIRHRYDGILVPPENVRALADSMEELMKDEELRKSLASKAVEIVERFSVNKVARMWEELFNIITNSKP